MKRRHFLGLAATSASALVCRGRSDSKKSDELTLASPHLLRVLRDPALIRQLGSHYRERNPAEDDSQVLRRAVRAAIPTSVFAGPELQVETAVRRDFVAGRIAIVDGWVLSLTEARQCALHSLLA